MPFERGDQVRFPNPDGEGETEATFLEVAVDQPIEVPLSGGATRLADAAWVELEDGTTARVVYSKLRPVE